MRKHILEVPKMCQGRDRSLLNLRQISELYPQPVEQIHTSLHLLHFWEQTILHASDKSKHAFVWGMSRELACLPIAILSIMMIMVIKPGLTVLFLEATSSITFTLLELFCWSPFKLSLMAKSKHSEKTESSDISNPSWIIVWAGACDEIAESYMLCATNSPLVAVHPVFELVPAR